MLSAVKGIPAGDVVLLHGCCHNPSGTDIALLMNERGIVPLVDLAYQGFGRGLEEDVAGVRELMRQVPELLVAFSCSKNFGLYSDRTGCALVMTENAKAAAIAGEHMALSPGLFIRCRPTMAARSSGQFSKTTLLRKYGTWNRRKCGSLSSPGGVNSPLRYERPAARGASIISKMDPAFSRSWPSRLRK